MASELVRQQIYRVESIIENSQDQSLQEFIKQINQSAILFLHQKFDAQRLFTGCVAPRQYKLYGENYEQKPVSNQPIVYAKEKSSCFTRHFCTGGFQPFQMNLYQKNSINVQDKDKISVKEQRNIFIQLDRKFACTFYCLFRPSLSVKIKTINGSQKFIGKIRDPFDFCPPREWFYEGVDIHDSQDNLLYIVEAHKFQCGIMFGSCCCTPCQKAKFSIIQPVDKRVVGFIEKKAANCFKNMVTGMSNFKITFPLGIGYEQKILILAATFFIQANMFIESPEEQKENLEDLLEFLE